MGGCGLLGDLGGVRWCGLLQIGPRLCGVRVVWGFEVVGVLRSGFAAPRLAFPPYFPSCPKSSPGV